MENRDFTFEMSRRQKTTCEDLHLRTLLDRAHGSFREPVNSAALTVQSSGHLSAQGDVRVPMDARKPAVAEFFVKFVFTELCHG